MSKTEPPKIPHGIDEIRKLFRMFEDDPGVFEFFFKKDSFNQFQSLLIP